MTPPPATSPAPPATPDPDDDRLAAAIRFLAVDMIDAAASGHPGLPLGMADVATVAFRRHLKFDAADPGWFDRDRFVLSAGHGSALLYAVTWLCGYAGVELDHLRRFRQLGSPTAGHPEHGCFPGVETTTGPLGQGLATAVGMAVAEASLRARFGPEYCNHRTWVLVGDGCLMEGISQEAIDLAGHLGLDQLIVLWDDNGISIDGSTSLATSTDQRARFQAADWHVVDVDGHDHLAIDRALAEATAASRPSLVACRTTIGRGAPTMAGSHVIHGKPLGASERAAMAETLGWDSPPFTIPDDVLGPWRAAGARGGPARSAWLARSLTGAGPELARLLAEPVPACTLDHLDDLVARPAGQAEPEASRSSSRRIIGRLVTDMPALFGGAADLGESCGTRVDGNRPFTASEQTGNYLHYGVREHAMAAAMNGLALHGGFVPYGATFLAFSDYSRPALRLAAMMGVGVIHVLTHDSIGVGEDGPTHQPVEHLDALRAIPGLQTIRPADATETAAAWAMALRSRHQPTALVLSRQGLAPAPDDATGERRAGVARGGYRLRSPAEPAVVLVASGSEVPIALAAAVLLRDDGLEAAVVSMPCLDRFQRLSATAQRRVLGHAPRVVIEAGLGQSWGWLLRPGDRFVGMTGFGRSGPGPELFHHFGITPAGVRDQAAEIAFRPIASQGAS